MTPFDSPSLTQEQAMALCDRYDIHLLLSDEDEVERLERYEPILLDAYEVLRAIADSDEG